MTLRKFVTTVALSFLIISFVFLGGWPFLSQDDTPPMQRDEGDQTQQEAQVDDKKSSSGAVEEKPKPSLVTKEAEKALSDSVRASRDLLSASRKEDRDTYRVALSQAVLDDSLPRKYRMERLRELREVNQETVFRPGKLKSAVDVRIKGGDSLTRIARRVKEEHKNNVTPAFLMKLNRLPNTRIRAGNLLSAPTESLSVLISKSDYRLYVLLGDDVVLDYPVGIGHSNSTPEGSFHIQGKTKNPTWTRPDGKVIPFGDPEHTIGTRWMGFSNERGKTPYGIHGTVENDSIGKAESEGCIRMLKDDVEEIFRLIPEGCTVTIKP